MSKVKPDELAVLLSTSTLSETPCNPQLSQQLLDVVASRQARLPMHVMNHGWALLQHPERLGDDAWELYERVLQAACDCGRPDIALACAHPLVKKFGRGSLRVRNLIGQFMEADQNPQEAEKEYDAILKEDPTYANAWKRKVALCKGEGDISSAIVELNRYLEVFQIDNDAWQELLDLYVAQRKFDLAKFVAEELIAAAPENYLNHLQYADILYTIGGRENVEMASVYYSQSLELNSTQNNLRAFYGTILCARILNANATPSTQPDMTQDDSVSVARLSNAAAKRLHELYSKHATADLTALVGEALSKAIQ